MDFSVIDRSGITQSQFAALAGVSRVTVNTWVRAKFQPRGHIRERVHKLVLLLHDAINEGTLPVAVADRRKESEAVLDKIKARLDGDGA